MDIAMGRLQRQEAAPERLHFDELGGWLTAILLVLLLLDLGWAISAAEWAEGLGVLHWVILGGSIVGILMALSRFSGIWPLLHSLVTGMAWVLFWVATLVGPELSSREQVYELLRRWMIWLQQAIGGEASSDNLIFILELAFLVWWLAFLAGWAIFRERRVWLVVLLTGLAMVINAYYSGRSLTGYLILYFLCALLLLVRVNLSEYEAWWRAANIRYAPDIQFDFLRNGFIFSLIVITLAWTLPTVDGAKWLNRAMRPLQEPWERVQEEWQRMFSALNYQPVLVSTAFGKTLTLSGERNVGDTVIMDVQAQGAKRWYWRAVAYDTYTGRGWINTDDETELYDPGVAPLLPSYAMRQVVTETMTLYVPQGEVLLAAPLPFGASVPFRADVSYVPWATSTEGPGTDLPTQPYVDISRMVSEVPIGEGDTYVARSYVSTADVESLREANTAYPDHILARYLQLPESLPEEVVALAEEITAPFDNVYDKAAALEAYLRKIEYDEQIPAPPPGVDGVAYFLFDVKAGYCDYYASAMAVMARSVGIPARIASGYAQGEWIDELGVYRVREKDAHTWVEIYFPEYGWIEFEPTAAQPLIERPERPQIPEPSSTPLPPRDIPGPENIPEDVDLLGPGGDFSDIPQPRSTTPYVAIGLSAFVLIASAIIWGLTRSRRRRLLLTPVDRAYAAMLRWAERVEGALSTVYTPYEYGEVLARLVPAGSDHIQRIVEAYVRLRFGRRSLSTLEQRRIQEHWQRLRPLLWREWISRLVGRKPANSDQP
ncbi:MAG: transglutaminaseTgpA domain-containing protein [Anaerolineae bacterium]